MLLSHKYRFIFIKTAKTAGTSIEIALSRLMGEGDVVTPVLPPEPDHRPRNYDLARGSFGGPQRPKFFNHMPALKVRQLVEPDVFNGYFKFCVEREPVDKCVSHYSMLKNSPFHNKGNESLTWDRYVERGDFPVDHAKYSDPQNQLLVDKIIRYENLNDELMEIARRLGFSLGPLTIRAKSGFREDIRVRADQRERIYELFAPSLQHTQYRL